MGEIRYSMTKPSLNNIYPKIQYYRRYLKDDSNPWMVNTPKKTQEMNNFTPAKPKEGKHTHTHTHTHTHSTTTNIKISEINNHCSLISPNINVLNQKTQHNTRNAKTASINLLDTRNIKHRRYLSVKGWEKIF